ncbi:hypothetical protein [[Clostridium] colinum]|uniref:hypothetical protein n=1 Tax=[Clostridium] colinum TaxID=36835 RepID=UPI0020245DFE|nr:hypothetical protein [[Clostridium] colinum]
MNKLSKRELILIVVLINLLAYYILFNVIGLAIFNKNKIKLEKYQELKAQQDILEIENLKNQINANNLESLLQKNMEMKNKIFSNTNNENIHYFISNIIKKSNLSLQSINIKKSTLEEDNENQNELDNVNQEENINIENEVPSHTFYNVEIEVIGNYKDKINFIKNIESCGKTIAITDFYNTFESNKTKSKIKMNIYTINKEKKDNEFIIK